MTNADAARGAGRPTSGRRPVAVPDHTAATVHTADVSQVPLGELFPTLPGTLLLASVLSRSTPRGLNALHRAGARYFADVSSWRIPQLRRVRNVGDRTAADIIDALAEAAATTEGPLPGGRVGDADQVSLADVQRTWTVSRAMTSVAAWATAFVDPELTLTEAVGVAAGAEDLPADVALALRTVRSTPVSQLALHVRPVSAHDALDAWFRGLGDRDAEILRRRTLARRPATLDVLSAHFGVSRERVRTLEASLLAGAGDLFSPSWLPLARALSDVRSLTGPIAPVADLPDLGLDAAGVIPWLEVDDVEVLARLSGLGVVDGDLVGWPDVTSWTTRIRRVVNDSVDVSDGGLATLASALDELGVKGDPRAWAERFGHDVRGDAVVAPARSAGERAFRLLADAGEPLSTDEIVAGLGVQRDPKSVRVAMDLDDRIIRVGPRHWALAEPGRRAFPGLREAIGEALAEHGGPMRFADLLAALRVHYVVASHSVRVYAGRTPHRTVDGLVSTGH